MRMTILSIFFCVLAAVNLSAQTTEFTYQGSFKDGANPANGNYDLEFKLFNLVSGGVQQGSTVQRLNVVVANGIFSVALDFGAGTLSGADRFLDISIRPSGGGAFTPLSPRQRLTSAPYSVRSLNSANADVATNATQLGGVAANQYVVTTDPRMTNERAPTAGSGNYVQNQNGGAQPSSNFNISGTGTANIINATAQFNLGGNRILSAPANNLFVGQQTGQSNTTGDSNSFFGRSAGSNNTSGGNNSFFGYLAGNTTNTGSGNAFFGYSAGRSNTTGGVNSFFGFGAGEFSTTANFNSFFGFNAGNKTTAEGNSFFGSSAGENNTTGANNSFVGFAAGRSNTTGSSNSFFGRGAGSSNTTGNGNSFVGVSAGLSNTEGSGNSFVGSGAGLVNTTGTYNTFIGDSSGFSNTTSGSHVFVGGNAGRSNTTGGSNTFVGKDAGFANTMGNENAFFGAATGQSNTTGSNNTFAGVTAGLLNTVGDRNSFVGYAAGLSNTTGIQNSFFGRDSGRFNQSGNNNSFFGSDVGTGNTTGFNNAFVGFGSGSSNTSGNNNTILGAGANVGVASLQFATAIGAGASVASSNTIALGRNSAVDKVVIYDRLGIGTQNPEQTLHVNGVIKVTVLDSGGMIALCVNNSFHISTCSSSLRYKTNILEFSPGMSFVDQLRPIAYDWKDGGMRDVGFGAEDIEKIDARFVNYNEAGEVEGVKYDRLSVAFVNAFKEQQAEIELLKQQVRSQQLENQALRSFVCSKDPEADFCRADK